MNDADFIDELIAQIMAQGYDRRTAGDYAVAIGDTPILDAQGNVLIMEGDKIIATLKPLPFFNEI